MKIGHIINPVNIGKTSDLYLAQPVTFQSMKVAKNISKFSDNIIQYTIGYEEDVAIFPTDFKQLPLLKKSVMDVGTFEKDRKLPLIKDILLSLKEESDLDYIIYTNVDIAVMPYFYDYIFDKIKNGSDSLIINRRVIKETENLNFMFAEVGDAHPGFDCFVFKKELLTSFILNNVCIGANWIGRAMITNLLVHSKKLEIITDAHLTFHIGEDGAWLIENFSEFDDHNKAEVYNIIHKLIAQCADREILDELNKVLAFMDKWGQNNTSTPKKIKLKDKIIFRLINILKRL